MIDQCWLPSAIIQTTGALLGLYLLIYIYASQSIESRTDEILRQVKELVGHSDLLEEIKRTERRSYNVWTSIFYTTVIVGCGVTIYFNTLWLALLTSKPDMIFPKLEIISILSFLFIVVLIIPFSLDIVHSLNKLRKLSREFLPYWQDFKKSLEGR